MNAAYWLPVAGQIRANEVVSSGHRTAREAWDELVKTEQAGHTARVACLKTIEHERPAGDPDCRPFESARYCVIVKKAGR